MGMVDWIPQFFFGDSEKTARASPLFLADFSGILSAHFLKSVPWPSQVRSSGPTSLKVGDTTVATVLRVCICAGGVGNMKQDHEFLHNVYFCFWTSMT